MRVEWGAEGDPIGQAGVTVGTFDGVHLAHTRAIEHLRGIAARSGWNTVVVTFDRHPRCVLDPTHCPPLLTTLQEKLDLLDGLGVDVTWVMPFTRELAALEAGQFMALLAGRLQIHHVVSGPDFALGNERRGDNAWLASYGRQHGFELEVMPSVEVGGVELHSSDIRRLLAAGEVAAAAHLLGRPFRLGGPVVRGVQVGRGLGYPTANIAVPEAKLIPADGVYAATVTLPGGSHQGALSIGSRPTFDGDGQVVEVHLLDFDADLYGVEIAVELVKRLRGQVRYEGPDALARQMAIDIEETRRILTR